MARTKHCGLSVSVQRLQRDYLRLSNDPVPFISAHPLPSNLYEWHYLVRGPPDTPYHDGYYHGKLVFPREYPFQPPSIYMITPNGRFSCNTRLCLSISDFHPDTWNPAWSVATILTGLLSFMVEDTPTMGSIATTAQDKKILARDSAEFNLKDQVFVELFPDVVKEVQSKRVPAPSSPKIFQKRPSLTNGLPAGDRNKDNDEGAMIRAPSSRLPFAFAVFLIAVFALCARMVMEYICDPMG